MFLSVSTGLCIAALPRWMRLSHARRAVSVRFDDPNLVSFAGLAAVLALAARCGLPSLLAERVQIAAKGGANAAARDSCGPCLAQAMPLSLV